MESSRYSPSVIMEGLYGAGNLEDDINMLVSYYVLSKIFSNESICVSTVGYSPYVKRMLGNSKCILEGCLIPPSVMLSFVGSGRLFFEQPELTLRLGSGLIASNGLNRLVKFDSPGMKIRTPGYVGFGIGLGPFTADSTLEKEVANYMADFDLITVRDNSSKKLCEKWGYPGDILECPDSAFLYDAWCPAVLRHSGNRKRYRGAIAIIVKDIWGINYAHLITIIKSVEMLRKRGYAAQFVSFHRETESQSLPALKGENILCWDPERIRLNEFLEEFSKYDLVITTRTHGAIVASCLGIPSISIATEPKRCGVRESLTCVNELWTPPFAPEELLSSVQNIERDYEHRLEQLNEYSINNQKLVKNAVDQVVHKIRKIVSAGGRNGTGKGIKGRRGVGHSLKRFTEKVDACKSTCSIFARVMKRRRAVQLCLLTWNSRNTSSEPFKAIIREASYLKSAGQSVNICVCDNGSTDGTVENLKAIAKSARVDISYICNPTNVGSSLARNQLIDHALDRGADYLLFVDSDIEIIPFSSMAMLSYLNNCPSNVGATGPPMGEAFYTIYREYSTQWVPSMKTLHIKKTLSVAPTHYGLFRTAVFNGGVRLEDKGPFNGPGWGLEDNDLAFQMFVHGWEIHTVYGVVYMHSSAHSSFHTLAESGINPQRNYTERREYFLNKWMNNPHIKSDMVDNAKSWKGEDRFMLQGIY